MTAGFPKPLLSAQTSLNRLGEKRSDPDFISSAQDSENAKVLVLADLKIPILPSADRSSATLLWLPVHDIRRFGAAFEPVFLGENEAGENLFAIDIPPSEAMAAGRHLERLKPLVDLRSLALQGVLPEADLLVAAQARAILSWHTTNRCCGRCGARMRMSDGGWRRRCTACTLDTYPRTDPAVIMLATHGGRCLLGHEHRFPDKMYSALAGFVEAGDDIEHAVRREIKEEAGISIGEVRYIASQPWPFPHSLMIGCWAEALNDIIVIDPKELADARWFSRDDVSAMMEYRHPDGFTVPPAISIAWTLLTGFANGAIG